MHGLLHYGRRLSANLVVGADGINSAMGGRLAGHPDMPTYANKGFGH